MYLLGVSPSRKGSTEGNPDLGFSERVFADKTSVRRKRYHRVGHRRKASLDFRPSDPVWKEWRVSSGSAERDLQTARRGHRIMDPGYLVLLSLLSIYLISAVILALRAKGAERAEKPKK
jgi:hypothetical protein